MNLNFPFLEPYAPPGSETCIQDSLILLIEQLMMHSSDCTRPLLSMSREMMNGQTHTPELHWLNTLFFTNVLDVHVSGTSSSSGSGP